MILFSGCQPAGPNLPTDGKAHASAYELGFQVSAEIASGDLPQSSDQRWLKRAKKVDLEEALAPIYEEIGALVSVDTIVCNDLVPLEDEDYPIRVRCWSDVINECKGSKVVVVVASENEDWNQPDWGIMGFGMSRSIIERSEC